ncbi:MAG: sugar phosphate isomerase/epimerase [Candidatus Coatesbacteria bacterium]
MPNIQIGLQLYTVRDLLQKDYAGTIRQVARIGYAGVEGGSGPMSREEFDKLLKELHLQNPSSGGGVDAIEKQGDALLKPLAAAGIKFFMVSSKQESAEAYKAFAKRLNGAGKACQAHGITFQYHNHAAEFMDFGGKTGYDVLIEETDPKLVWFQVDVGWVSWAGKNGPELLRRLKGRIRTIHVKDHTPAPEPDRKFTEVGTGAMPLAEVVVAAKEIGVEWAFVEQDWCARPSIEAAEISFNNLKKALGG